MPTIKRDALATRLNFHEELDRLLQLLAAQRAVERRIRQVAPVLQRGETAEAQAVLAAQLRFKRREASL
jgi:hypothetical protein